MSSRIYIKNMVCQRCIKVVKQLLKNHGLAYQQVILGEVILNHKPTDQQLGSFQTDLKREGFDLLSHKNTRIVEKIKNVIVAYVHYDQISAQVRSQKFSHYLSRELGQDYSTLSHLFSSVAGITIEKYLIHQKVERVKELLKYGELNLTEIARDTGYSSVQYLSNQFKKVTGLSPSAFKRLDQPRQGIDAI